MSIFKPRTIVKQSSTLPTATIHELTKNQHYCVSKLPALPSVFKSQADSFTNAYSDSESNYSLVINEDSIFVWCYKSTDATPLSIEFPIDKSIFQLPMAILTRPSSGTGQDPGLVILDSVSGLIKFYESVQHAPTLGLINDKSLEIDIPLKKDEYITLAENVEPAGIVIATSLQRCILISLRDFKSKPQLGYMELLNNEGFLQRFFKPETNEIVAIRSGKITNHGTIQEILVLDSSGNFYLYNYNLFSATASPYVDKKKSFRQSIRVEFDAYPGSNQFATFLDIWPVDDIYLALCKIEQSLYLVTLRIDKSGALPFGSHKLKTANFPSSKPKLYLPKPGKTAFVIIDNSVILTDLNTSYIESKNTLTYYKPRWEDVVRFKSSVEFVGSGFENQSPNSNPAVILISKKFGVVRIEKFPESQTDTAIEPLAIVRSHIEQAIFYSDVHEIDFDLSQRFEKDVIQRAIETIIEEILTSTSSYFPKTLPSISDLTNLKVKLYRKLIEYVKRNFDISIIPQIVENLEKTDVAHQMWTIVDANQEMKTVLETQLGDIREFFTHNVADINPVLTKFIENLVEKDLPTVPLVVKTLYNGVYLNEVEYVTQISKSWVFTTNLIIRAEEIFTRNFVESEGDPIVAYHLVQVLYYFVNSAIAYMRLTPENKAHLQDYQIWYNNRKQYWIGVLLKAGLEKEATEIAEKYHDFASLARILDIHQEETNSTDQSNYSKYFEEYGYSFASCVYDYYLEKNKIQELLLSFTNYKHFLLQYFKENPKKTANVSWIRYLLDTEFAEASNSLIVAAEENDSLDNQHIKYSLAKLSSVASGNGDNLKDINHELLIIKYQKIIKHLTADNGRIEAIKKPTFTKNFVNQEIDKQFIEPIVDIYFDRFVGGFELNNSEIINLLTTVKPSISNKSGFSYAFKIAESIYNKSIANYYSSMVLVRLLVLGDEKLYQVNDNDKTTKRKAKESALYKTLKQNPGAISKLDQLLNNPEINNAEYEDSITIKEFNESLLSQLTKQLGNAKFKSWVEAVKEQARI